MFEYPKLVSISDYLAGEETSGIKHEYLGGIIHAMAGGSIYRRKPEGGFGIEVHTGESATIPLPEIDTQLALAELFENAGA